jgi:hypothetical protein
MRKKILVMAVVLPVLLVAQTEKKQDVWEPMKFLVGVWEGKGEGKSGISAVSHDFEFIMKGRYLHMRTKATFEPQEKNPKGEVHEDWGFFSHDRSRKKIVFRQFHVEGFITQYVLEDISEQGKLVFATEQIENAPPGLKARLTFRRLNADALEVNFELSFPGREFDCYSLNTLKRKSKS